PGRTTRSRSGPRACTPTSGACRTEATQHQSAIAVDGKQIRLAPGMNLTAEIKTGKRRVIEFLLSPIQRAGSESLRER
ncbi:hypothetical protein NBM50_12465, partial [Xylophilus ampelinus]|nr:hypothetical protein [Xylophilus ampelinus]